MYNSSVNSIQPKLQWMAPLLSCCAQLWAWQNYSLAQLCVSKHLCLDSGLNKS